MGISALDLLQEFKAWVLIRSSKPWTTT